jgi:rhomboid protease GluP
MPAEPTREQLAAVLHAIAAATPAPWYPSAYALAANVDRSRLDEALNRLRVAGFVRLTDWEPGKGQGYAVTTEGQRALASPARLERPPEPATVERPPTDRPADGTPVTRTLIAAQLAMFAVGLIQAGQNGVPIEQFLEHNSTPVEMQLAVSRAGLVAGLWYTLLTYALVHGGLLHLAMNLVGHATEASFAERLWGSARFAAIYLAAVVGGGVGAVVSAPAAMTVGSSGGLCGVIAAQVVWLAAHRHRFRAADRQVWARHYVQTAILITLISVVPGVSWGGHLGGAVGGTLAGGALLFADSPRRMMRVTSWLVALLLPLAAAGGLGWWLRR